MSKAYDVTVCIPTIPTRADRLKYAMESVRVQTGKWDINTAVALDMDGNGAAVTRNQAWRDSDTEWIAFLDDDDTLRPNHINVCLEHALDTKADLVYPWFNIHDGNGVDISQNDPLSVPSNGHRVSPYGVAFGPEQRHELMTQNNFIPITVLVRREVLLDVGGMPVPNTPEWSESCCEDWGLWRRLLDAGASFSHVPRRTWIWNWHGQNTSGKSWRSR